MKGFQRPSNQKELEEREAAGFWKAIGSVNKLSRDKDSAIDTAVLCQIHRTIFDDAIPEIAGRYRQGGEDVKKLHHIVPPPGAQVAGLMVEFARELEGRLATLPSAPKTRQVATYQKWVLKVIEIAAWAQHQVVAIHPFSNGNGRTARLFSNLILQKQGLTGSRIKFEQSDKPSYLNALAQIDKAEDYGPLVEIILRAMKEQYESIRQQKISYLGGRRRVRRPKYKKAS